MGECAAMPSTCERLCAHCGGKHGPAYPLASDALVEGRLYRARTPICLRCVGLALDASTTTMTTDGSSR